MNQISQPPRRRFGLAPAVLTAATMMALSACGGGDVDEKAEGTVIATKNKTYTVGGNVGFSAPAAGAVTLRITALADGSTSDVVVANNAPAASPYTFDKAFFKKESYAVSIADAGSYQCIFTGSPTGVIDKADVTNLDLFCTVPPPPSTADFTVVGAPGGSSLTAQYRSIVTFETVAKIFTIGADRSTYSFDESFLTGTPLLFDITQQPAGYTCASSLAVLIVNVDEPVVTCSPIVPAN